MPGPTSVSIAAGPLVGPVLRRVVGMAAARADLPLGVRELCRQIGDEATFRSQTLSAVVERTMEQPRP